MIAFIPRGDFLTAVEGSFEPGMNVVINMSRDDLANLVGTARENVVRMLSGFREEGAVETKGSKIMVLDVKRLIEIANFK